MNLSRLRPGKQTLTPCHWQGAHRPRLPLAGRTSRRAPLQGGDARHRPAGFTLIELMVTVALTAILMALAAPQLTNLVVSNRLEGEANDLQGDLQLARAAALQQGLPVEVCPSSDATSCLAGTDWRKGWVVFTAASDNALPGSANLLRRRGAFKGSDTIVASAPAAAAAPSSVRFNRAGYVTIDPPTALQFIVQAATPGAAPARCVNLDVGGRIQTLKSGQTPCS